MCVRRILINAVRLITSDMLKSKQGIAITLAIVLLGAGLWFWYSSGDATPSVLYEDGEMRPYTAQPSGEIVQTTYDCPNGDMFTTSYDLGSNEITLETDARDVYVLPQAVSETGARYATFDGSVVFYEEAGAASVEVDGEMLHVDCVAMDTE